MKDTSDIERRFQQLEINQRWLLAQFDLVHESLCPDHLGTWQQRVTACVKAAKKLKAPKVSSKRTQQLDDDARHLLGFLNDTCRAQFKYVPANLNLIKARLKEHDVTVEGVEQMIRRQFKKWSGTDMEEYLRPSTLFRASKFVNYYAARELPVDGGNKPKRVFGDLCYEGE